MRVWMYPAGWVVLATIYAAALAVNGVPAGLAARNAAANLLPAALLGVLVLRYPARRPLTHAASLAAFVALSLGGWIALVALDTLLFDAGAPMKIHWGIVGFRVLIDVLIYCTLAGVAYAREQMARAAAAEALRARASLEAMRSQLNPHFILNTYHALVGLVRRDPAVAESALERLGDLLRYSLRVHRDGVDEVPLREECAFTETYLALERLRLADRLRVSVDTPPGTLEYLVPTFAVQILVENAIRHAIAPRAAGGSLQIRVQERDGRLRVTVKDESAGEIVHADGNGSRMGLRLLQDRLHALYGHNAQLTIRAENGGTCAEVELPARRIAEDSL
jgi:Histidine kinase